MVFGAGTPSATYSRGQAWRRVTAIFVILVFTLFDAGRYAPQGYASPAAPIAEPASASFSIPKELGKVEESFRGTTDKTVIFIQDAHDSLEAQENIAKLIGRLVKEKGIETVFEEGYEGPVPTDKFFGFIKDPMTKQKVSYFLLDKLRIGGAEYAHVNRANDFKLIGVEDLKLYGENIKCYQKSSASRKDVEADLGELFSRITALGNQYFPKDLKAWLKWKELFSEGKLPLLNYLKELQALYLKVLPHLSTKPFIKEYPALTILLNAEMTQDPKLIQQLNSLDSKVVFSEVARLEKDISEAFLQNQRDREIFSYYQGLDLLKGLNRIELTQAAYEAAKETWLALDTQKLADFIVSLTHRSLVLSKAWESHIKDAVRFYDVAQKRDGTIDQHIKAFSESKEEAAILVFGGFHASAIKDMLRQQGFSYAVISPKITSMDKRHQDYYKHLMSKGYHDFEIPFLVTRANKPPSALYAATLVGDLPIENELHALAASVEGPFDLQLIERRLVNFNQIQEAQPPSAKTGTVKIRSEIRENRERDWEERPYIGKPWEFIKLLTFSNWEIPKILPSKNEKVDYIVGIGASIRNDGSASTHSQAVAERAVQLYRDYRARGRTPKIIFSGGYSQNGVTEAESMKRIATSLEPSAEKDVMTDQAPKLKYGTQTQIPAILQAIVEDQGGDDRKLRGLNVIGVAQYLHARRVISLLRYSLSQYGIRTWQAPARKSEYEQDSTQWQLRNDPDGLFKKIGFVGETRFFAWEVLNYFRYVWIAREIKWPEHLKVAESMLDLSYAKKDLPRIMELGKQLIQYVNSRQIYDVSKEKWRDLRDERELFDKNNGPFDVMMVFGSGYIDVPKEAARITLELRKQYPDQNPAMKVIVVGNYGKDKQMAGHFMDDDGKRISEAEYFSKEMRRFGAPPDFMGKTSENTLQNVREVREVVDQNGLHPNRIIIVSALHRRAGPTFTRHYLGENESLASLRMEKVAIWSPEINLDEWNRNDALAAIRDAAEEIQKIKEYSLQEKPLGITPTSIPAQILNMAEELRGLLKAPRSEMRTEGEEIKEIVEKAYGLHVNGEPKVLTGSLWGKYRGHEPYVIETRERGRLAFKFLWKRPEKARYAVEFMQRLREYGLPVPELVPRRDVTASDDPTDVYIMEYRGAFYVLETFLAEGREILREDATEEHFREIGKLAARIQNAVEGFKPRHSFRYKTRHDVYMEINTAFSEMEKAVDSLGSVHGAENEVVRDVLRRREQLRNLVEAQLSYLGKNFPDLGLHFTHIHNDLHLGNLKFAEDGSISALFDFNLVQEDHRIAEFNNLLFWIVGSGSTVFRPEMFRAVLAGYEQTLKDPLTPEEKVAIWESLRLRFIEVVNRVYTTKQDAAENMFRHPAAKRDWDQALGVLEHFAPEPFIYDGRSVLEPGGTHPAGDKQRSEMRSDSPTDPLEISWSDLTPDFISGLFEKNVRASRILDTSEREEFDVGNGLKVLWIPARLGRNEKIKDMPKAFTAELPEWRIRPQVVPIFADQMVVFLKSHAGGMPTMEDMRDMLKFAMQLPGFGVYFSGPGSGASVPEWRHFQLGKAILPIEQKSSQLLFNKENVAVGVLDHFIISGISFTSRIQDEEKILKFIQPYKEFFDSKKMAYNLYMRITDSHSAVVQVILVPRKAETTPHMSNKPAVVEVGGWLVTETKTDFEQNKDLDRFKRILLSAGFTAQELMNLLPEDLKNSNSNGRSEMRNVDALGVDIDAVKQQAMAAPDLEGFLKIVTKYRLGKGLLTTDKTFFLTGVYDFLGKADPITSTMEAIEKRVENGRRFLRDIWKDPHDRLRFFDFAISYQYSYTREDRLVELVRKLIEEIKQRKDFESQEKITILDIGTAPKQFGSPTSMQTVEMFRRAFPDKQIELRSVDIQFPDSFKFNAEGVYVDERTGIRYVSYDIRNGAMPPADIVIAVNLLDLYQDLQERKRIRKNIFQSSRKYVVTGIKSAEDIMRRQEGQSDKWEKIATVRLMEEWYAQSLYQGLGFSPEKIGLKNLAVRNDVYVNYEFIKPLYELLERTKTSRYYDMFKVLTVLFLRGELEMLLSGERISFPLDAKSLAKYFPQENTREAARRFLAFMHALNKRIVLKNGASNDPGKMAPRFYELINLFVLDQYRKGSFPKSAKSLKILLLQARAEQFGYVPAYLPIGLPSLAAAVKGDDYQARLFSSLLVDPDIYENYLTTGKEVRAIDFQTKDASFDFEKYLSEFKPDIVGIRTVSASIKESERLARVARTVLGEHVQIHFGGYHVTALPEQTMTENKGVVNVGFLQEAEETYPHYLAMFISGKDPSSVPGICYFDQNGKFVKTVFRRPVIPFDEYPSFMDHFDILPDLDRYAEDTVYSKHGKIKSRMALLVTERGCKARCAFCPTRIMFGAPGIRYDSVETTLKQMEAYYKRGYRIFNFRDDNFTGNRQRVMALSEAIIKKGWKIAWTCMSRADTVDEALLTKMVDSGLSMIAFGVESGSEDVLRSMEKRELLWPIRNANKWSQKLGIYYKNYYMVGAPGEKWRDVLKTLLFMADSFGGFSGINQAVQEGQIVNERDYSTAFDNLAEEVFGVGDGLEQFLKRELNFVEMKPDSVNVAYATPYPGSPWYDQIGKKIWMETDVFRHGPADRNNLGVFKSPTRTVEMTRDEISEAREMIVGFYKALEQKDRGKIQEILAKVIGKSRSELREPEHNNGQQKVLFSKIQERSEMRSDTQLNMGAKIFERQRLLLGKQKLDPAQRELSKQLQDVLKNALDVIDKKIAAGEINPFVQLKTQRHASDDLRLPRSSRKIRVGVLPVTGNPLIWGHLLLGLHAMKLNLDTVVLVVQGEVKHKVIPEKDRIPLVERHRLAQRVIGEFYPFLRYSDVGLDTDAIGEATVHDLRHLNLDKNVEFVYLSGVDSVETMERVVDHLKTFSEKSDLKEQPQHQMSLAMHGRGAFREILNQDMIKAALEKKGLGWNAYFIGDIGLQKSSTIYRDTKNPALVPPLVDLWSRMKGWYGFEVSSSGNVAAQIVNEVEKEGDTDVADLVPPARSQDEYWKIIKYLDQFASLNSSGLHRSRIFLIVAWIYKNHLNNPKEAAQFEKQAFDDLQQTTREAVSAHTPALKNGEIHLRKDIQEVRVRAPLRIDIFSGSGFDLLPISMEKGGRAINVAVQVEGSKPVTVTVRSIKPKVIKYESKDTQVKATFDNGGMLNLVETR